MDPPEPTTLTTYLPINFSKMEAANEVSSSTETEDFALGLLQTGYLVDKYYTPLLCISGVLGNSLSLLVFWMDANYRKHSSSYYLSALAVSDSGFLLTLFAVWLESAVEGAIITSPLTCPLVMYLGQVTCFVSVYLTVGFSLERYVAVNFPFSRPRICTRSKAKKFIAAVITLALVAFSYALWIAKVIEFPVGSSPSKPCSEELFSGESDQGNVSGEWIKENSTEPFLPEVNHTKGIYCGDNLEDEPSSKNYVCTVPDQYYKISEVANYLDSAVTLIIPFLLIAYFHMSIAKSVWKLNRQRQSMVTSLTSTVNLNVVLRTSTSFTSVQIHHQEQQNIEKIVKNPNKVDIKKEVEVVRPSCYSVGSANKNNARSTATNTRMQQNSMKIRANSIFSRYRQQRQPPSPKMEVRVTKTLLVVSSTFLILNLPLHVIRCTQFLENATGTSQGLNILQAFQPWANMLFNTNFAVNFLLYCMSGSKFRKSLGDITARVFKGRKSSIPIQDEGLKSAYIGYENK